ncbi:MAG: SirB2 family protein [Gammaproteobacteria bacterium]|jgi:uncharacterized membrane protein SirB2
MIAKDIHVASVVITFALFFVRGLWMITDAATLQRPWVRRVPHVIDTILLISGIVLTIQIQQYPLVHGWLTAKIVGLLVYIGLGMLALTYGRTKRIRITTWIAAQLCFFYIFAVAVTKNPLLLS